MTQRTHQDPLLEVMARLGDEGIELAGEMTDEEADALIEALDEAEAQETARDIAGRLRAQGHIL